MQCSSCGSQLAPDAVFCGACGTPVAAQAPQYPASAPTPTYAQPSGNQQNAGPSTKSGGSDIAGKVFNFAPIITKAMDHGSIFKVAVSWFIRILAILVIASVWLVGLGLLASGFMSFQSGIVAGSFGVIAGVVCAALCAIAGWTILRTMWLRAEKAHDLKSGELTALPLTSLLIKLNGEVCAILSLLFGIITFIIMVFAPTILASMSYGYGFGGYGYGSDITYFLGAVVAGVAVLLVSVLSAFVVLFGSYYLAEAIEAMANIARDASGIRRMLATRGGQQD